MKTGIRSIAVLAFAASLLLGAGPRAAAETSGSVTLTSDYVFRGISQTMGDPAVQFGWKLAGKSGAYGAIWASNVDFGPASDADLEVDLTAGWSGARGKDWTLDVNLTHYAYPGASTLDYTEVLSTGTWRDRVWVAGALSNDEFATGKWGAWVELGGRWRPAEPWRLELAAGHQFLPALAENGYTHARVGAAWTRKQLEARVNGHWSDSKAGRTYGEAADSRAELALTWSF